MGEQESRRQHIAVTGRTAESAIRERLKGVIDWGRRPTPADRAIQDERILDRVVRYWGKEPWEAVVKGVPWKKFTDSLATRTFVGRRLGGGQSVVVKEVILRGLDPEREGFTNGVCEYMDSQTAIEDSDPNVVLTEIFEHRYGAAIRARDQDAMSVMLFAWIAARSDDEIRDAAAGLYVQLDEQIAESLGPLAESWGRHPISPFTWETISLVTTIVVEGMMVRSRFDDRVTAELLGEAVLGLYLGLTTRDESDMAEDIHRRATDSRSP